jgi:hypothetical protein
MQNEVKETDLAMIQNWVQNTLNDLYKNNFGLAVEKLEGLNKILIKYSPNHKPDAE